MASRARTTSRRRPGWRPWPAAETHSTPRSPPTSRSESWRRTCAGTAATCSRSSGTASCTDISARAGRRAAATIDAVRDRADPRRCRCSDRTPSRSRAASQDGSTSSSGGGPGRSASSRSPRSHTRRDGFELTPMGAMYIGGSLAMYEGFAALRSTYEGVEAGDVLRQPGLARHDRDPRRRRARRVLPRADRERDGRDAPGRRWPARHRGSRGARGAMGRAAARARTATSRSPSCPHRHKA